MDYKFKSQNLINIFVPDERLVCIMKTMYMYMYKNKGDRELTSPKDYIVMELSEEPSYIQAFRIVFGKVITDSY